MDEELKYTVIVDCGSSGSRAHIFKWKKNPKSSHIQLIRDDTKSKHITPGLSAFKDEPHKASDYMKPIMEYINDLVPSEKQLETSIYFMATAGLRLLEDSTRKAILNDINRDLRVEFNFPKIKSQVITGEQEGIYSWVSLNMNKNLKNENSQYSKTSYGMIEMGGASTQVAFELDEKVEKAILKNLDGNNDAISAFKKEQRDLNVGQEKSVKLLTVTFLGLGVNSAREAAIDLYVNDFIHDSNYHQEQTSDRNITKSQQQIEFKIRDACLPSGSSETVFRPKSLLNDDQHNKEPGKRVGETIGPITKQSEETFKVILEGDGDLFNCINHLERVIQLAKKERLNCEPKNKPCNMDLLGTNFIPYDTFPFIGLSEMFFTTNEMMNSAGQFNRSKVLHETKQICSTNYKKLLERYSNSSGSPPDNDRVLTECFKASWLLTMLHRHGLRMPTEYENFRTLEELNGEVIDWTTGALLMEAALKH